MKKIMSFTFFKVLLAAFALMASAFFVTQYNHYKDLRDGYLNTAQRISQSLSSQFSFFYHNTQNITYNRSVRELNRWESREYFDSLVALYPYYDVIVLSDADGNYVASNTIGSEGESLDLAKIKDANFFAVDSGPIASEDIKKGFLGTLAEGFAEHKAISEMYGRKKIGMRFSSLVRSRSGKVLGKITTFINHDWLNSELLSLSKEVNRRGPVESDVFLLNKDKLALASNLEEGTSPLSELPFKVATANFSKHSQEGNLLEGVNSFAKFLRHPFFIISNFNHQNFLSEMGWSLVIKMNKEQALGSIINSLAWFWGAFLLFALGIQGLKLKAVQRLDSLWKIKEREGELSFEEALERANFKEVSEEGLRSLGEIKKLASITLPGTVLNEAPSREPAQKLSKKAQERFNTGFEELQLLDAGRAAFSMAIEKRKSADKKQKEVISTLSWNINKAKGLLQDLRVHALNVEIGDSAHGEKARELDAVVENVMVYFDETKRMAEGLSDLRESSGNDLSNAWRVEGGCFSEAIQKARKAFEGAKSKAVEMSELLESYEEGAEQWSEQTRRLWRERKQAGVELEELVSRLEQLEELLSERYIGQEEAKKDQKEENKKAA